MPRFGSELPTWTERYRTDPTITPGNAAQLRMEVGKLGDRYLATAYNDLPIIQRASILGDVLTAEILDRFLQQNCMLAFS